MLTDKQIANAELRTKPYKLGDRNGLYLFLTPKGHKSWRYKYRFAGKEQCLIFGAYPDISLADAREQLDACRKQLREGKDPKVLVARQRIIGTQPVEASFEKLARAWHDLQKDRWKPVHANDVLTSMERDLFPHIGAMPVQDIDVPLMLAVLRKVEQRGAIETAHRLRQRADKVFRYALSSGVKTDNPAASLGEALKPVPPKRRWPALVDVGEVRKLIADVDQAGASPVTRLASRFLALVAQRPGMVRHAEWEEFRGIDWDDSHSDASEALWHIPAGKMKLELQSRRDSAFDHVVPLSPAAVEVLRTVRILTGRGRYVFCNGRSSQGALSENAIGYLYNREGYRDRHVPHGWRSSFSTIMNDRAERALVGHERLLIDRFIIDLMLAHTPSGMSETELRYNRARYMDRRRELANEWAALIMAGATPAFEMIDSPRRKAA